MSDSKMNLAERSMAAFSSMEVEDANLIVWRQVHVAQFHTFNSVLRLAPEKGHYVNE